MCIAVLRGAYWISVVSPLFTMLLTLGVSGIPMQEKQQAERWGKDPAFHAWKRKTHLLVPLPKYVPGVVHSALHSLTARLVSCQPFG